MDNSTKERLKKVEKFVLGTAEFLIDSMSEQAKTYSKNSKFSQEYREQYAELSEGLETLSQNINNFKNRDSRVEEYEDDEWCEDFLDHSYNESNSEISKEETKRQSKKYNSNEKKVFQRGTANSNSDLGTNSFEDWDSLWMDIGKITNLSLEDISNNKVGLIKLICNGSTVLILRAISLKNGGIRNKLAEIVAKKYSNRRITKEINENYDFIDVEILEIGKDDKAINVCRNLETKMIKAYNPLWLK